MVANNTNLSMARSFTTVSGLSSNRYSPVACSAARLLPRPNPVLWSSAISFGFPG